MFCPKCGLQQADSNVFCQRCGKDLTKKREKIDEISAGAVIPPPKAQKRDATPGKEPLDYGYDPVPEPDPGPAEPGTQAGYYPPQGQGAAYPNPPGYVQPGPGMDPNQPGQQQAVPPQGGQYPPQYGPGFQGYAPPQYIIQHVHNTTQQVPRRNVRRALPHLALRRVLSLLSFATSLAVGAVAWYAIQDQLEAYLQYKRMFTFDMRLGVCVCVLVLLGTLSALIGMGTIYSRSALSTAFVMSGICAGVCILNLPGGWTVRLATFTVYALVALVDAIAAMPPPAPKPEKPPKLTLEERKALRQQQQELKERQKQERRGR